jgi:hypothetical protein
MFTGMFQGTKFDTGLEICSSENEREFVPTSQGGFPESSEGRAYIRRLHVRAQVENDVMEAVPGMILVHVARELHIEQGAAPANHPVVDLTEIEYMKPSKTDGSVRLPTRGLADRPAEPRD